MATRIQFRRGLAASWTSANPLLAQGELGIELDTDEFKIGDGILAWNDLPYGGLQGPQGPQGEPGVDGSGVVFATSPIEYDSATDTVSLNFSELVIDGGTA